jgi:hypothetical protein
VPGAHIGRDADVPEHSGNAMPEGMELHVRPWFANAGVFTLDADHAGLDRRGIPIDYRERVRPSPNRH